MAAITAATNLAIGSRTLVESFRSSTVQKQSVSQKLAPTASLSRTSLKASTNPLAPRLQKSITLRSGRAQVTCGVNVKKVTAPELDELLMQPRTVPMVIDFYATWCGPCVLLAQELEKLALEYGSAVQFVKVDTDEEYQLAQQLEIRGLPTMVFVSHDKTKPAQRTEGLLPRQTIMEIIQEME
eukprot:jgi/Mesen1/10761/ME000091S10310